MPQRLAGQLLDGGTAVADEPVFVVDTGPTDETTWSIVATDRSAADGSWSVTVPNADAERYHAVAQFEESGTLKNALSKPFLTSQPFAQTGAVNIGVDVLPPSTIGSVIPDSEADQKLIHRWLLDDVNGTVEDSVGSADGTNNGVTSVSGDWIGGSAGEGDGVDDYIDLTTLGDFGSSMHTGFALAFTVMTADNDGAIMGTRTGDSDRLEANIAGFDIPSNKLGIRIEDSDGSETAISSSDDINTGTPIRVVFNCPTFDGTDWQIYFNQSVVDLSVEENANMGQLNNFGNSMALFARNFDSIDGYMNGVIDDLCIFDESLTQTEAQSYSNPWD